VESDSGLRAACRRPCALPTELQREAALGSGCAAEAASIRRRFRFRLCLLLLVWWRIGTSTAADTNDMAAGCRRCCTCTRSSADCAGEGGDPLELVADVATGGDALILAEASYSDAAAAAE
jgi:hypothetical protein